MWGQLLRDDAAHRADQLESLRVVVRSDPETVRQSFPVGDVDRCRRALPEVTAELRRHLENGEFVSPGSEAALSSEPRKLGHDGNQGVVRRLMGEIVQLGASDRVTATTSGDLGASDPQQ